MMYQTMVSAEVANWRSSPFRTRLGQRIDEFWHARLAPLSGREEPNTLWEEESTAVGGLVALLFWFDDPGLACGVQISKGKGLPARTQQKAK
eukprot:4998865-Amphidinium_carterae.1